MTSLSLDIMNKGSQESSAATAAGARAAVAIAAPLLEGAATASKMPSLYEETQKSAMAGEATNLNLSSSTSQRPSAASRARRVAAAAVPSSLSLNAGEKGEGREKQSSSSTFQAIPPSLSASPATGLPSSSVNNGSDSDLIDMTTSSSSSSAQPAARSSRAKVSAAHQIEAAKNSAAQPAQAETDAIPKSDTRRRTHHISSSSAAADPSPSPSPRLIVPVDDRSTSFFSNFEFERSAGPPLEPGGKFFLWMHIDEKGTRLQCMLVSRFLPYRLYRFDGSLLDLRPRALYMSGMKDGDYRMHVQNGLKQQDMKLYEYEFITANDEEEEDEQEGVGRDGNKRNGNATSSSRKQQVDVIHAQLKLYKQMGATTRVPVCIAHLHFSPLHLSAVTLSKPLEFQRQNEGQFRSDFSLLVWELAAENSRVRIRKQAQELIIEQQKRETTIADALAQFPPPSGDLLTLGQDMLSRMVVLLNEKKALIRSLREKKRGLEEERERLDPKSRFNLAQLEEESEDESDDASSVEGIEEEEGRGGGGAVAAVDGMEIDGAEVADGTAEAQAKLIEYGGGSASHGRQESMSGSGKQIPSPQASAAAAAAAAAVENNTLDGEEGYLPVPLDASLSHSTPNSLSRHLTAYPPASGVASSLSFPASIEQVSHSSPAMGGMGSPPNSGGGKRGTAAAAAAAAGAGGSGRGGGAKAAGTGAAASSSPLQPTSLPFTPDVLDMPPPRMQGNVRKRARLIPVVRPPSPPARSPLFTSGSQQRGTMARKASPGLPRYSPAATTAAAAAAAADGARGPSASPEVPPSPKGYTPADQLIQNMQSNATSTRRGGNQASSEPEQHEKQLAKRQRTQASAISRR